jgi:hypothetical protein
MIQEIKNHKNALMLTSDHWHVLRAWWIGRNSNDSLYRRTIESEHDDRDSATTAARGIAATFGAEMDGRSPDTRDQILVRRPGYKSLKISKRVGTTRD